MSQAKTAQTEDARTGAPGWRTSPQGIALVGIALPFATLGLAVLLQHVNGDDSGFDFVWWSAGAAAVLLVVAAFLKAHAQAPPRETKFAARYMSAGMVDDVLEEPSEGAGTSTLMITAELPGQVRIRRKVDSTMHPSGLGARVGQTVIFRHNTVDPDDLQDVLFVRFAGAGRRGR